MSYRERLPQGCPPDTAEEVPVAWPVFRLVRPDPPTDSNFRFYYDGPQVFEARDAVGGHYIAVMVGPELRSETAAPSSLTDGSGDVRKGRRGMNGRLTAIVEREGDSYIALCPEVDVASQGDTVAEAGGTRTGAGGTRTSQ